MYLLALAVLCIPLAAYAQEDPITLHTDSESYRGGDVVVVYGKVIPLPGEQLTLRIQNNNNVMQVDQFSVAKDGTYTYMVNTNGTNWNNDGQYTVLVRYGQNSAALRFDFVVGGISDDDLALFEVADGGSTFDVWYAIDGGQVSDVVVDPDNLAIRVSLDSTTDGTLLLDLPREYIDASYNGDDEDYIVLIDDVMSPHTDDMGSDVRRVEVKFPPGAQEIMVIGTEVVPEFGTALWILAAAAGTAAASRYAWRARI